MAKSGIFLESKEVLGSENYHLYLIYKDESGNEYVIRGGSEFNFPPFGKIVLQIGIPLSTSDDSRGNQTPAERYNAQIDLGGRTAEDVWNIMLQQAKNIADSFIDYDLLSSNSNSTVVSVLNSVGLTVPAIGGGPTPGSDNLLEDTLKNLPAVYKNH